MSKIKTAVIPIAGTGTRFLPITKVVSKEMLSILDRPLIDYAVQEAVSAGIKNFIFITNGRNKSILKYYSADPILEKYLKKKKKTEFLKRIKKITMNKSNIKIIVQKKPEGLGNAILKSEKYLKGEDFCVILPDDLIKENNCSRQLINAYNKKNACVLGVIEVPREEVDKYGIIDSSLISGRNIKIKNLIEKPNKSLAPSNLAIVGRYVLKNKIFKYLRLTKKGSGGEYQLTDAISLYNKDLETWGYRFKGKRYDCSSKYGFFHAQLDAALADKDIKVKVKKLLKIKEK